MSDVLRRLYDGLRGSGSRGDTREYQQDSELRAPELAPPEVTVGGASVTSIAFRATIVVLAVIAVALALWELQHLVLITLVALIVAAAMHAPVVVIERRGIPRPLAILIAYTAVLGAFAAAFIAVGGPLVAQVQQLFDDLPQVMAELRVVVVDFFDGLLGEGQGEEVLVWAEGALAELDLGQFLGIPLGLMAAAANAFIVLFLSAFFVYERDVARNFFLPLLQPEKRDSAHELARSVLRRLAAYVHGRFVVMLFIGAAMTVSLLVLGVPFALPLGVFAFLVEIIPMVGPWLAIIPAFAIAFLESPEQALALAVIWFVVQQIESYVLTPAVMGRFQHLPPSVVLLSVLAGFYLFGVVGAIIGVPVVAVALMVIQAVFVPARKQAMGEREGRPRGRRKADEEEGAGSG